jgi:hypothetical protein
VTTGNYKESQTVQAIQIFFLQYKKILIRELILISGQVLSIFSVNYKIESSAETAKGIGYYPDVNLYINNLPEYGFGNQINYAASESTKQKVF